MCRETIANRPEFSHDDAAGILREHFAINGTDWVSLPSERDQNLRFECKQGQYVLKIANAGAANDWLELQNKFQEWLQPATQDGDHFLIPQAVTNTMGESIAAVQSNQGDSHLVRVIEYLPGKPWALIRPFDDRLLNQLGGCLGQLSKKLQQFPGPALHRDFDLDLERADVVAEKYHECLDADDRGLVRPYLHTFQSVVLPLRSELRQSWLHNDANDYNVLVSRSVGKDSLGLIDFGDISHGSMINELAIAIAYTMLSAHDPLADAAQIVAGFDSVFPIEDREFEVLFPLAMMRLCISLTMAAKQSSEASDPYLTISSQPARRLLSRMQDIHPRMARAEFRSACSREAWPSRPAVVKFLQSNQSFASVVSEDFDAARCHWIDSA